MISDKKIEETLRSLFSDLAFKQEPRGLYAPLDYMIEIGGKRLRPRLCLTAYSLYRDSFDGQILSPAAALEVFHSFTLIHDDIMDRSPLRRGRPTVWKKWGEDTAILSGDVMNIESFRLLMKAPPECLPAVLDLFSLTEEQVCEGQQYDMDFEQVPQVSMEDYMKMIGLKTAVLIACSAKLGAIIAGAPAGEADALYSYGYDLGLAFQIADDYLDVYGDEKVFGKPIGGDILNGKKTWLLTRALEKTSDRGRLLDLMSLPAETREQQVSKITFVKAEYNSLGISAEAQAEIERLSARALHAAAGLPGQEALKAFAEKLIGRVK